MRSYVSQALLIAGLTTSVLSRPLTYPDNCLVFDDCPARSHCYPLAKLPAPYNDEADPVNVNVTGDAGKLKRCACNHFVSEKGDFPMIGSEMSEACHESQVRS